MKAQKNMVLIVAVAAIAAFSIGASGNGDSRPPSLAAEKWIALGDKAGFAVSSEASAPVVAAELYVKTDKGWRRARVDNPVSVIPLQR